MRKTVHLCLSSHEEVMFRSEADLNMGFNCLALSVLHTESRLLDEGFMTTHHHILAQTDSPVDLTRRSRNAYTRYFNAKYHRQGRLGERTAFCIEISGIHHTMAALNYVLRQGLHHGLSATPFGYPHCSARCFFKKDLGRSESVALLPTKSRYLYLPSNTHLPIEYRMTNGGLLLREDILDTAYVEELYITPRNFLYQMNRIADEKDELKQEQENDLPIVTMDVIEQGVPDYVGKVARIMEQGRVDHNRMTDLELCNIIDGTILPRYFKDSQYISIYLLSESKRANICEVLLRESQQARWTKTPGPFLKGKNVTENQLRRCLCLPPKE